MSNDTQVKALMALEDAINAFDSMGDEPDRRVCPDLWRELMAETRISGARAALSVFRAAVEASASWRAEQGAPRKADDVDLLLRAVFELCEATEEAPEVEPKNEHQRGFDKGRRFEAKAIRRAVSDWFQATFCGRSFMGEPVLAVAPKKPVPFNEKRCTSCGGSLPITERLDQTGECECTTPPPAPVLSDADPLHLSRILHELAGAASLCWSPKPEGEFDSQQAIGFVEAAIAEIRARAVGQAGRASRGAK